MKSGEVNFWDYVTVLIKWRKLIVINFIVVCILASAVSLALPKWYKARATLLPPVEQTTGPFGLASALSELPLGEFGIPGMRSPFDIFKAILESRTVAEAIVKKYNLMEVYRKTKMEDAVLTLLDRSRIEITVDGTISISVEERTPQLAAAIANSFVEELDRVNQMASISQAKSTRIFIEGRLEENQENLKKAEDALRRFQEENKTVSLTDQTTAAIQSAAELKARQVALEVEKGVLLKNFSKSHPQVVHLQSVIEELQKQLDQITLGDLQESQGGEKEQPSAEGDFNIPLLEVPSVGLQLARLTREVKIQEAIFELLTQQYEQAKIQEARDTPTVQVLDRAIPPERRSKPKRKVIVLVAGVLSIFTSAFYAFSKEYLDRLNEAKSDDYQKLRSIIQAIKSDLNKARRSVSRRSYRNTKG